MGPFNVDYNGDGKHDLIDNMIEYECFWKNCDSRNNDDSSNSTKRANLDRCAEIKKTDPYAEENLPEVITDEFYKKVKTNMNAARATGTILGIIFIIPVAVIAYVLITSFAPYDNFYSGLFGFFILGVAVIIIGTIITAIYKASEVDKEKLEKIRSSSLSSNRQKELQQGADKSKRL